MPTYVVTNPDTGQKLRLTGDAPPSDTDLDEIFSQQEQQPKFKVDSVQAASPRMTRAAQQKDKRDFEKEQFLSTLDPARRQLIEDQTPLDAFLIGAGRGLTNIGRGVGLVDDESQSTRESIEQLKEVNPGAVGFGEIVGETAPFLLPATAIGNISTLAPRVLASTGLGVAEGGIIQSGRGGTAQDIVGSAGIGGAVAGGLEVGLPVVGRMAGALIRKVTGRNATARPFMPDGQPSQELQSALDKAGLTIDDLNTEGQRLVSSGQVDDAVSLSRKQFLESQGLTPTRAQVTGDASEFQAQQELGKTSGAVRRALEGQEGVLVNRFENAVTATGGSANPSRSTANDYIADRSIDLDVKISDAYRAAREAAPTAQTVRPDNATESIRAIAGSDRATGGLASATADILRGRGVLSDEGLTVVGKVDVATAEEIRKDLNALHDSLTPFGKRKLKGVKDALDSDVEAAIGFDVFKEARAAKSQFEKDLSRAKVNKFDSRKKNLVRDILENEVNPDRFLDDAVLSKSIRSDDVEQLKRYLLQDDNVQGVGAWNDLRSEALERIKTDAFKEVAGQSVLSRAGLEKSLDRFGRDKLRVLFTGDERRFLNDMLKTSNLREPVRGTALGKGPSGQAIGQLENTLKRIPLLAGAFEGLASTVNGRLMISPRAPKVTQALKPITGASLIAAPAAAATSQQKEQ